MAAPSVTTFSTGQTDAGGAWSFTGHASLNSVGLIQIAQILQDGSTNGAVSAVTGTNINNLAGSAGWTQIPGTNADGSHPVGASGEARQFLYIGRNTSATLASTISGANSTSEDLYCLIYVFADSSAGTVLTTVIENGSAGATVNSTGTSDTMSDAAVTSLGPDRLGLQFGAVNDDNTAVDPWSSNWTLYTQYTEASGTDGAVSLSYAAMPSATTLDGGTISITDPDAWGVVGFALIGTTTSGTVYQRAGNMVLA